MVMRLRLMLLVAIVSCSPNQTEQQKPKVNPEALMLNEQIIPLVNYYDNVDSSKKALWLLDSATVIDSNCYTCYYNKLLFLNTPNQSHRIGLTLKNLIRIRPNDHSLYLMRGNFYAQQGDTVSGKMDFQKSLEICDAILDTTRFNNPGYDAVLFDKAVILVMLDQPQKSNELFKQLCDKNAGMEKDFYCSCINKNKTELLAFLSSGYSEGESFAEKKTGDK